MKKVGLVWSGEADEDSFYEARDNLGRQISAATDSPIILDDSTLCFSFNQPILEFQHTDRGQV